MGVLETLRRREQTIALVRWAATIAVSLGLLLGGPGERVAGLVVVVLLAGTGVVVHVAIRRLETPGAWRRFAGGVMAADASVVAVYVVAAVADGSDLTWGVLALLSLEGALRYRFKGATTAAVCAAVLYVPIELSVGTTPARDLAGRVVLLLIIGAFGGSIALELDVERRLFERVATASHDIVGKRDAQGILTTFASHVAAALDSAVATVYAYDLSGFHPRATHRRTASGTVQDLDLIGPSEDGVSALLHRPTWRGGNGEGPGRLTVPIRLPERPAEYVLAVAVRGPRPSALTEAALMSLSEATAVSLGTLDVLRHQEASTRRLERLEVLRTRFVATVAHDLRSPLTTVKGVASILRDRRDSVPPERVDLMLESVERQANRLNRLADDLLDAARLDSEQLELKIDEVDLVAILEAVAADAADEVQVLIDGSMRLRADGARLERVVWNLISNALKYGRPPIVVRATSDPEAGVVRIRVRDHGSGLSTEQKDRMFTDFAAGDDPDSVGLGLAIVWQLTAAHGGTVTYSDADPGACFTVTIPVADQPGDDRPAHARPVARISDRH